MIRRIKVLYIPRKEKIENYLTESAAMIMKVEM